MVRKEWGGIARSVYVKTNDNYAQLRHVNLQFTGDLFRLNNEKLDITNDAVVAEETNMVSGIDWHKALRYGKRSNLNMKNGRSNKNMAHRTTCVNQFRKASLLRRTYARDTHFNINNGEIHPWQVVIQAAP